MRASRRTRAVPNDAEKAPEREEVKPSPLEEPLLAGFPLSRELAFYIFLIAIAALLRFWDLGSRAFHHDESLHALYSWYLYTGRGYRHDPMMHGPFQFHVTAFIYFLFGASDYAARIPPALFGTALVGMPYFLRGFLGRTGALVTAALLAFSPSLLYFSRFARNDIYIAFWNLLLVVCLWRYVMDGRRIYLYLGAAALSLAFATKEVTYITVAIFGSFLVIATAKEVVPKLRQGFDLSTLSPMAAFMVVIGALALPQGAAGSLMVFKLLGVELPPSGLASGGFSGRDALAAGTIVGLFLVSLALGLRWNKRLWLTCVLVFYSIFVVLFTTFFTNPPGFFTGTWGGLEYWLAQHGVQRGAQPWYYYLVLTPIYEFLPLTFSMIAAVYYLRKRDRFAWLLTYWIVMSYMFYSYAGEKMPWLVVHITLPLVLLAGKFIGGVIEGTDWRALGERGGYYFLLLLAIIPFALRALLSGSSLSQGGREGLLLPVLALGAFMAFVIITMWSLVQRMGVRLVGRALALGALGVLAVLTVRTALGAAYYHGDIPVEMLVYTQTSPEVPRIMKDIDRLARETGQGKELPITVDASDGFTWPWAWYLRDYKKVDYPALTSLSGPPLGSVLLLNANNQGAAGPYLGKYGPGQRFPHRWWFPEDYRGVTWSKLLSNITNPQELGKWWRYFVNRELSKPLGSSDAVAYFPKDFAGGVQARGGEAGPSEDYARLALSISSELAFGRKGADPGTFDGPKGIALGREGNIYVVDSLNHRVQKFDSQGRLLAQVGRQGSGPGEFSEPWGVGIDKGGSVYVADTWNHRIQKFDPSLRFVAQWGGFADTKGVVAASPGRFYGPRDIAIDPVGNLYVVDTGNKRVQKFSPEGAFLGVYGGPGKGKGLFMEPVGIGTSPEGDIFVADTWNRRVQRFDKDFNYLGEFSVNGWQGEGVLNKPYLAIDPQGNVLVTDPENHRVLRFSREGNLLSVIGKYGADNASFNLPMGISVDREGKIYVTEAGNHRVQRFRALK